MDLSDAYKIECAFMNAIVKAGIKQRVEVPYYGFLKVTGRLSFLFTRIITKLDRAL